MQGSDGGGGGIADFSAPPVLDERGLEDETKSKLDCLTLLGDVVVLDCTEGEGGAPAVCPFFEVNVGVDSGDAIRFDMEPDFAMSRLLTNNCILR